MAGAQTSLRKVLRLLSYESKAADSNLKNLFTHYFVFSSL